MGSYTASELEQDTGFGRRTIAYYIQEGLLPRVGRRGPRTRYPELVRDRLLFIRRVREAEAESEIRPVSLGDLRELFKAMPAGLVASVAGGDTPITPDIVSLSAIEQRSMVDRVAALRERLLDARPGPASAPPVDSVHEANALQLRAIALPDFDEDLAGDVRAMGELGPQQEAQREEAFFAAAPPAMEAPDAPYHAMRAPASRREETIAADADSGLPSAPEPEEDADTLGKQLSWVLNELQAQARRRRQGAPADAVDTWSQVEVTSDIRLSIQGMAEEDAFLLRVAGRLLRQVLESGAPSGVGGSREPEE